MFGKTGGSGRADVFVVQAGDHDGRERQTWQGHRGEAAGTGWVRRGFYVAWCDQEGAFDRPSVPLEPVGNRTAAEAMGDENNLVGREGGGDFVQGVDPIILIRCVPIPLIDTDKAV